MDNYELDELKSMIGDKALYQIVGYYGLREYKNGEYDCIMTEHKSKATMKWLSGLNFHCCNCDQNYDIVNHAKKLHPDNMHAYLKDLAGVGDGTYKPVENVHTVMASKPVSEPPPENIRYNNQFSGLPDLKRLTKGISQNAENYLESRRISLQTAKQFGLDADDGIIYLNYWSIMINGSCTLCKIKGRKIGDLNNSPGKYIGITGGESILFGAHFYRGQRRLIITEGEFDCMAMYQAINYVNAQNDLMAVSVPSGAGANKWIEQCQDFLKQFETVIICPDGDPDGIKMRETCFERMTALDIDVRWIDIRRKTKKNDINALLIESGLSGVSDLLKRIEEPYHTCGLTGDQIKKSIKKELYFTGFYGLDRCCKFQFGETAVLAGESNDGKTTVCRQIANYAIKCGHRVGGFFGEEESQTFRELGIRQAYGDPNNFTKEEDYFGDLELTPTDEAIQKWSDEYGRNINLFQVSRVRDNKNTGDEILDWMRHCADVEGRRVFIIDNLMKITAGDPAGEFVAQARFIEQLYNLSQQKGLFSILIVHTKKIEGFINVNSISGTKKIYNTPDYVLFFQRLDRMQVNDRQEAATSIREIAKVGPEIEFTLYMRAHKIRNRPGAYNIDTHILRYDQQTTRSVELLPVEYHKKTHNNGYSELLTPRGTVLRETDYRNGNN